MTNLGPLPDGGRVVIVGGGPGGVATALSLHQMARRAARRVEIILLEGKHFAGGKQHNLSVGVLSPPLFQIMEEQLGAPFPWHLPHVEIAGYILHSPTHQVTLDDGGQRGAAVRRVYFDEWMLETARERGIDVREARAVDIDIHDDGIVLYTDRDPVDADVVVGAFGLDDGCAAFFRRAVSYRQPPALTSVLTKYHPGEQEMAAFGSYIHAFLPGYGGIEFGAITPKGDHLDINIAGRRVRAETLKYFLARPEVRSVLPSFENAGRFDPADLRFFKGRFPNSLAGHYYGDRYVMVGDAAGLVRAFKGKGVTSAVQTGIRAAETILRTGISAQAFASDFAVANQDITGDLIYGRGMRFLVAFSASFGLIDPVVRAAGQDEHVREALFGAVSAHAPYRNVLVEMVNPKSVKAVMRAMLRRGGETLKESTE
jgi:flavin-dependent dehydrogenase